MVTYTNSSLYWSALKPRINIYALNDISYSSPIYTYNPFTDVGVSTKPVSLSFDSQTTNAGSFSVEIEDADSELDMDTFTKGNRIVIDCSKNGSTWQPAFKGLIRSSEQTIYAPTGKNFTLSGYSYIVRLNERILNVVKESSLVGTDYDRTDANMFTNNLVENLLDDDQNYVFSSDDFDLYTLPSPADISTSSIQEWLPRLDAELVTVGSAIDSVLEYSNSLITVDLSTDKWAVYNPDLIQPLTQVFLITDNMVQAADDGDITMYPLASYRYNVSYDYPDSGSRLIVALNTTSGGNVCFPPPEITDPDPLLLDTESNLLLTNITGRQLAAVLYSTLPRLQNLKCYMSSFGDASVYNHSTCRIREMTPTYGVGPIVGSPFDLYRDGIIGNPYPNATPDTVVYIIKSNTEIAGPAVTPGKMYWIVLENPSAGAFGYVAWNVQGLGHQGIYAWSNNSGSTWTVENLPQLARQNQHFRVAYDASEECGGGGGSLATSEIPDPQFVVAHDLNATNRLGIVERAITSLPRHITTLQTINEYLYAKLYVSAKPRFTFDFPSVSMPNRVPKAGDIVTHVSRRAGVGLKTAPLQTGVIMSVNYNFDQGDDGVLGLRNVGLQTTGIRRGSY